jgi:hypothetical protein
MMEKKSYLAELCAHSLVEMMSQVRDVTEFEAAMVPSLGPVLAVAPDECSPEQLALMLVAHQRFGYALFLQLL